MIADAEQAISTLHAIRDMGSAIAMDDFGTGYSSLSYLRRFPFDKIKIDQSFVSELGQREDSAAIVRAATGLAKALGMEAVAEGVETEEQLALVAAEGCAEVQGYLIGRPMPALDVFAFSASNLKRPPAGGPRSFRRRRAGAANEPFRFRRASRLRRQSGATEGRRRDAPCRWACVRPSGEFARRSPAIDVRDRRRPAALPALAFVANSRARSA